MKINIYKPGYSTDWFRITHLSLIGEIYIVLFKKLVIQIVYKDYHKK